MNPFNARVILGFTIIKPFMTHLLNIINSYDNFRHGSMIHFDRPINMDFDMDRMRVFRSYSRHDFGRSGLSLSVHSETCPGNVRCVMKAQIESNQCAFSCTKKIYSV